MKYFLACFFILLSLLGIEKASRVQNDIIEFISVVGFGISVFYLIIQLVLYEINKIDYD